MTTTMPAYRITTLQYLRASLAERLGLEPEHEGATPEWASLLRAGLTDAPATSRADDTPTAVIPAVRRELPALAAVPYREVHDEHLGVLLVGPITPPHLFNTLARGAR
ncbi:hypothetical protein [Micromonospora sp. NPDC051006]|uniref:hypothetical protein n=1 Tax=Micromonospora sp. NPDC051006 TaxID=3364283 RepID=UPI0037B915C3